MRQALAAFLRGELSPRHVADWAARACGLRFTVSVRRVGVVARYRRRASASGWNRRYSPRNRFQAVVGLQSLGAGSDEDRIDAGTACMDALRPAPFDLHARPELLGPSDGLLPWPALRGAGAVKITADAVSTVLFHLFHTEAIFDAQTAL